MCLVEIRLVCSRFEFPPEADSRDDILPPWAVEACMKKVQAAWNEEPYVIAMVQADLDNTKLTKGRRHQRQRSRFATAMWKWYGGQAWLRILFALGRVDELCVTILNDELSKIIVEKEGRAPRTVKHDEPDRLDTIRWQGLQDAARGTIRIYDVGVCANRTCRVGAQLVAKCTLPAGRQDKTGWSGSSCDCSWGGWQDTVMSIERASAYVPTCIWSA
jgi:hypothetical protein